MSKYTTEVRYICESKAGLEESTGASDVNAVIAASWDKIFTTSAPFFDEAYRPVLCSKILKHYYLREIGCETVGIWLLWMNTRLEEILPYYNQLYQSARIEFDPMKDVDYTHTHHRTVDDVKQDNGSSTGTSTTATTGSGTKRDLYSDTPQGGLTGLENETYLTDARKVTDSTTESQNVNASSTTTSSGTANSTEDYTERVLGKQGGTDYSSLLMKFRETFINIDMLVISEFSDLFMGLW